GIQAPRWDYRRRVALRCTPGGWKSLRPNDTALQSCNHLFEHGGDFVLGQSGDALDRHNFYHGINLSGAIHARCRRIRFSSRVESAQCQRYRFLFVQVVESLRAPVVFVIENAAYRRRARPGRRVIRGFKLRAHRVVEIEARLRLRTSVVSRENRNYYAEALHDESKIVTQQFRERSNFSIDTHFLQLSSPKILE